MVTLRIKEGQSRRLGSHRLVQRGLTQQVRGLPGGHYTKPSHESDYH